jgi:hypothetical protein
MSKNQELKMIIFWIGLFLASMLYTRFAKASDLQIHLVGATYGSDLQKQKAFVSPTLGFTYSKQNIFYSGLALPIEDNKTSFVFGGGYKEEIFEGFYFGGMASMVMKYSERPSEYREKDSFSFERLAPMAYGLYFLPWLVVEKRVFINDDLSISLNGYVNHLSVHANVGLTFTFGE